MAEEGNYLVFEQCKEEELAEGNEKDRISDLPDEIRCHILSFLPTKCAVRTSVLSTRWRHLWTNLLSVNIDDSLLYGDIWELYDKRLVSRERELIFANFVNRLFMLHTVNSAEKFHLQLTGGYDSSRINSWISAAIKPNIQVLQELRLSVSHAELLSNHDLFNCEKLVIFKLNGRFEFNVPNSMYFPSLKTLHLIDLPLLDSTSTCIELLLSGSPVLEKLKVDMTQCCSTPSLHICSSSLKRLIVLLRCVDSGYDDDYGRLTIDTPNLKFLKLNDFASEEFNMLQPSSLVKAVVIVGYQSAFFNKKFVQYADMLVKFLTQIPVVKILCLSQFTLEVLVEAAKDNLPCFENLPTLWNLIRLEVEAGDSHWWILPEMFEFLPNLKVFVIHLAEENDGPWRAPKFVPHCLFSCLKVIQFKEYVGEPGEMDMLGYMLKNAMVLKKMNITFMPGAPDPEGVVKKVQMFPKGSSTCQIAFF